jgi:hypothetical protein
VKGRSYGLLVAEAEEGATPRGCPVWRCACACGNSALVPTHDLLSYRTRSCGCAGEEGVSWRERQRRRKPTQALRDGEVVRLFEGAGLCVSEIAHRKSMTRLEVWAALLNRRRYERKFTC